MNILIVANHFCVCSARYASEAFARLGHTVHSQHPDATNEGGMGRNIWGLRLPESYAWKPSQPMNQYICRQQWDLVLFMDSDPKALDYGIMFNDPDYADQHPTRKTIVWGVDNHVREYRREWFDHYFLAHRKVSVMDWNTIQEETQNGEEGCRIFPNRDMTHLSCCYDPIQHTPSPIPWEERQYDVAILGMMYPQRMAAVRELKEAGLTVIWGCGAVGETYRDLHHTSRIALNLSFNGDAGQRVFETAAMGCVVMSDLCPDFELLKPEGFWLLEDGKTLAEQVKSILSDPQHAQLMIRLAQTWVKPHSWDNRAQTIVEWYEREHAAKTLS